MISGDDFAEFMQISDEWEKVFGESAPEGPMISADQFPLLRECLAQKSQAPLDRWVKAELAAGRIY